jgi:hypothetical protein
VKPGGLLQCVMHTHKNTHTHTHTRAHNSQYPCMWPRR